MKNLFCASLILISSSIFITSCSKERDVVPASETFLVENDNHLLPIGTPPAEEAQGGKPRRVTQPTPTPTPTPTGSVVACLYFDFDGETVHNSAWNGGANFYCQPALMTAEARALAMSRVELVYAAYNVTVTDDVNVYNNAAVKQRIIVTPTSAWYNGSVTGVARIGSLFQSTNIPAFVFTDRLSENTKYIGDIMMHESGHTIGLRHQSDYDQACSLLATYKRGTIMGYPFDLPQAAWIYGTTTSCNTYQDDNIQLSQMLGLR